MAYGCVLHILYYNLIRHPLCDENHPFRVFPVKRVVIVSIILFLVYGCGQDKERLKDTVIKYNSLLAEGYRNLNMNPLVQVATEEQATKAYYYMAAIGEARIKMDAKIQDIKFIDFKAVAGGKAEIRTEEVWDYTYINIDSGKPIFDNMVTYRLKYILEQKSGKWLVADINVESTIEKKSSEYIFKKPMKENTYKDRSREK